jgi:hypothetical protein
MVQADPACVGDALEEPVGDALGPHHTGHTGCVSTLVRRLIITIAVVGAGVALIYVGRNAVVGSDSSSSNTIAGVERLIPTSGSNVLTQSIVGIDIADGYDATLDINGTIITDVAEGPEDEGLRKNLTIGLVEYVPGPGKEIESLNSGRNCVIASVWKQSEGPTTAKPMSWCFDAA